MDTQCFELNYVHEGRGFELPPEAAGHAMARLGTCYGESRCLPGGVTAFGGSGQGGFLSMRGSGGGWRLCLRLDVDEEIYSVVQLACLLAVELRCEFYAPELATAMPPVPSTIVRNLMQSEVWRKSWGRFDSSDDSRRAGTSGVMLGLAAQASGTGSRNASNRCPIL